MLRTPVSAIFTFAPKTDNAAIVMLHYILGNVYSFTMLGPPGEILTREKLISKE